HLEAARADRLGFRRRHAKAGRAAFVGDPRLVGRTVPVSASVVVLSGGLDSTVCMALAHAGGAVTALSFDYGQRHRIELERAAAVAAHFGASNFVVSLDASAWG